MRTRIMPYSVALWLSANDTYNWANRPGNRWPCSQLSGNRIAVCFDDNGLCEFTMNGKTADVDGNELSACYSDHLRDILPQDHPLYFIAVDQFDKEDRPQ